MNNTQLYIDGIFTSAANGRTIDVVNPANAEVIGTVACAEESDLKRAAEAAEKAFANWRDIGPFSRSEILRKTATLLRERATDIASVISLENGKTEAEGAAEVAWSAEFLDWCAEEGRRTYGRVVPARLPSVRQTIVKEPVGPVLALTPWNWPLVTAVKKISAALAAGCTVVLKPAEETPTSLTLLAQAFQDAGMPAGVFNVVFGDAAAVSDFLIKQPEIKKVAFTGSVPVGAHLTELAGRAKKSISLELGGHAPVIIFEDADLDKAVEKIFPFKFRTAGQVCSAPTRMIVHESLVDAFAEKFASKTAELQVGAGNNPAVQVGPLVSERRLKAVTALVDEAKSKGAEIVCGGERIGTEGYFYSPTVLKNVSRDAAIMHDEPFGPLAPVISFSTFEEALEIANETEFGLAGYIFTQDLATAHRAEKMLDCGNVGLNTLAISMVEAPFGGFKSSGTGKEGGTEGLETYLRTKLIVEDIA